MLTILKYSIMKAYIYNMVCPACKFFVKLELVRLGIECTTIDLGFIELPGKITEIQMDILANTLQPYGLELVNTNKILKKINIATKEFVERPELGAKIKWQAYLSQKVQKSYPFLNTLFTHETGTTLEKYLKAKKVYRAIELLVYYKLNLTEITYQLNYSSISNLSSQFKTVTGMTPLKYKNQIELKQEYQRGY
jgi:AraC-like DNA-binding protein